MNPYFTGKTILVFGGYEDNLNPEAIHFNEDGRVELERCEKTENSINQRRVDAVGEFLDNHLVVCGGWGFSELSSDCEVIRESDTQAFSLAGNQDGPIFLKVSNSHVVKLFNFLEICFMTKHFWHFICLDLGWVHLKIA